MKYNENIRENVCGLTFRLLSQFTQIDKKFLQMTMLVFFLNSVYRDAQTYVYNQHRKSKTKTDQTILFIKGGHVNRDCSPAEDHDKCITDDTTGAV